MSNADIAVLEALELPLNGPRRFWLGFVFVDDRRLAARARELADEVVRGRRRELETHVASDAAMVEAVARTIVRHRRTESPVWVDWSGLASSPEDRSAVDRSLAMLNVARTRMTKALRGGIVIAAPRWAEPALARGAVDLWSGGEFALRLRPDPQTTATAREAAPGAPLRAQLWHRIAPIAVMRSLREEGAEEARRHADALAAMAGTGDALRLETVAAGLALKVGDRDAAATRALAVIESGTAQPDVLVAALEIAAGTADRALAEDLWRRAVDMLRQTSGEEHPDTLTAMGNLASSLSARGDYGGGARCKSRRSPRAGGYSATSTPTP